MLHVQERIKAEAFHKRISSLKALDAKDSALDFPKISMDELHSLTVDIFELKLARN